MLLWWAVAFALMFGSSAGGWIGGDRFFAPTHGSDPAEGVFFLFQAMF
jgi:Amt family ammonium transporter